MANQFAIFFIWAPIHQSSQPASEWHLHSASDCSIERLKQIFIAWYIAKVCITSTIFSIFLFSGLYNLSGSFQAAILGKDFSWKCSTSKSPNARVDGVIFTRDGIGVGMVIKFPNGTCVSVSLHPRYDYQCATDHTFFLIIPANNTTEYENNSKWQCEYIGGGYRSSNQLLKIAGILQT